MTDNNNIDLSTNGAAGRTLGGSAAEPLPSEWARPAAQPRVGRVGGPPTASRAPISSSSGSRIASLRDLANGGHQAPRGPPPPHNPDGDDESDEDGDVEGEKWFAGGERSGINVENPDRPGGPPGSGGIVKDILRKAAQAPRPADEGLNAAHRAFFGSGVTLGSDDVPSTVIPDLSARPADEEEQETAIRNLTFWKDGFSIEDGPLMEYENEQNKRILDAINNGNAPPSILNVRLHQPVELRVARRTNEVYQPPPKRQEAFSGAGHRLGSPVPGVISSSLSSTLPGSFPSSSGSTFDDSRVASITTRFEVDQALPTTSVQIRLVDGTRLVSRMNLTHTVGDIRSFINASRPGFAARSYTIGTTFPNRVLDDDALTIDKAGLANSVIVMRWT